MGLLSGTRFDEHLVAARHEQGHGFGNQGHALFLKALLLGDADDQFTRALGDLKNLLLGQQCRLACQ